MAFVFGISITGHVCEMEFISAVLTISWQCACAFGHVEANILVTGPNLSHQTVGICVCINQTFTGSFILDLFLVQFIRRNKVVDLNTGAS
jgi:hypothetical protein